jgi:hypothetical protein
MFYLPMSLEQSLALAAMTLVGMSVALYLTRHRNAQTRTAAEVTNPVALKQED